MLEIATVAASTGLLFAVSLVLLSCTVCKKIFGKKQDDGKKEERVNIPEIKIDIGEDKNENGIANPGYQGTHEDTNLTTVVEQKDEEKNTAVADKHTVENEGAPTTNQQDPNNSDVPDSDQAKKETDEGQKSESQLAENTDIATVEDEGIDNTAFDEGADPSLEVTKQDIQDQMVNMLQADAQNPELRSIHEDSDLDDPQVDIAEPTETDQSQQNKSEESDTACYEGIVFQGEWRQPVTLIDLLESGLITKETADEILQEVRERETAADEEDTIPDKIAKYVCGVEPVAGIIVTDTGEKQSIYKAAKDGILRRGTAISLLEAQAATGNIIDPVTGRKMTVQDAAQLGLLDKVYEAVLLRAERAVTGYKFRASDHILSLYEAMQKGLVVESHGLRLLEAQHATGGIIDHRINVRVPLDVAVQRELLDDELKCKLEDEHGEETKTFFDPNTEQNVTYSELMRRSVVDNDTGLRLYPLERLTKKRVNYGSYSGRSSLASSKNVSRSGSRENLPAAIAAEP